MRYVFGPVTSHRLGLSLGLDLVPRKTCNFNCIYCELGPTRRRTARRAPYVAAAEIARELEAFLHREGAPRPDVLTLCGSGEPTLNSELGAIIASAKGFGLPVALLTNGSLFVDAAVRAEALGADIILPSCDAADDATLARVNRPLPGLSAAAYVRGLVELRREFRGRVLLEVMLVAGVNDSAGHLERLASACREISPERVQLTTVLRPPALAAARPVDAATMAAAREVFERLSGCPVDVPREWAGSSAEAGEHGTELEDELLALLSRRPATAADAAAALGAAGVEVIELLERLYQAGSVERREHRGQPFYVRRPASKARRGVKGQLT